MIFLRHPVTDAPPDFCYGQTDVGLGAEAADQIAAALRDTPRPARLLSSDLSRCRTLAEALAGQHEVPVHYDARLREYDFGAWEGRLWSEIPLAESEPWTDDLWNARPPGGESMADLQERVIAVLANCGPDDVIVCHAGVIRAARMWCTGETFEAVFAEKVPFCTPLHFPRRVAA